MAQQNLVDRARLDPRMVKRLTRNLHNETLDTDRIEFSKRCMGPSDNGCSHNPSLPEIELGSNLHGKCQINKG